MAELIEYARVNGLTATKALSRVEQKTLGQFMTPPSVAQFMAQRCLPSEDLRVVRILDPAAGVGILSAAVVECLLSRPQLPEKINLTLYEMDARLIPFLRQLGSPYAIHGSKSWGYLNCIYPLL